jgi:hypothetical protein
MEKRISKKVEDYLSSFKQDIKKIMIEYNLHESDNGKLLLQSILDKPNLSFTPEDFIKRQRAKNTVNILERCSAKRANGELCSRKKKKNSIFCGTHCKGTPYGSIDNPNNIPTTDDNSTTNPNNTPSQQKINIFTIEIQGIIYYIDDNNNAYSMEDILLNKNNPRIIGTIHKENKTFQDIPPPPPPSPTSQPTQINSINI